MLGGGFNVISISVTHLSADVQETHCERIWHAMRSS